MAALEFDGLLTSRSVFVSPVDRYGQQLQQHADDRYMDANITDEDAGGGVYDLSEDPQWKWAGPADDVAADNSLVDPENQLTRQQQHQDHGAASPERLPPADYDGVDSWEDGSGSGGGDFDDEARRSWVRTPSVGSSINSGETQNGGAPSPTEREASARGAAAATASAAAAAAPPSSASNFEDQPIRGLAGAKEMSLDELIAQGERQMREAQAKTAQLRPSLSSCAASGRAGRQGRAGSVNGARTKDSSRSTEEEPEGGPPRGAVGSRGDGIEGRNGPSSTPSNLALGGGGGLRVSLRSGASVATSWSGGDLSMGVTPAVAAVTSGAEEDEEESREGRERREFYELEMELLREESGGGGASNRGVNQGRQRHAAAAAGSGGQHEWRDDDFWDDGAVAASQARRLAWTRESAASGSASHGTAGRFRPFSDDADPQAEGSGAEGADDASKGTEAQRGPRTTSLGSEGLPVAAPPHAAVLRSGEAEERSSAWRGDGQILAGGGGRERGGGDSPRDSRCRRGGGGGGGARSENDEDPTRWEGEDSRDDHWPGNERYEMGQASARQGGGNQGRPPLQDRLQQPAGDALVAAGTGRRTGSEARAPSGTMYAAAPHSNGSGGGGASSDSRYRAAGKQNDTFEDDRAWGDVGNAAAAGLASSSAFAAVHERGATPGVATAAPRHEPNADHQQQRFSRSGRGVGVATNGGGGGGPWSSQAPFEGSALSPSAEKSLHGAPSQSKLVQRVFGSRGRRGGGRGGGGRGRIQPAGHGVTLVGAGVEERGRQGADGGSSAVQAELQGKLHELEEEISRYKEENERARLARRKQETALAEIMRKRQEVREWAEAEKAAVEAWCTEQRQACTREKRAALKQIQGLRARAQAGAGLGGGTAVERRQRQEIEGLKATIERAKLDSEAAKKKARASERRLQQQIKAGAERVAELEGQVSFLERQRVDVWASATATGGALGGGGADRLSKSKVAPGVSRSMNAGVSASARKLPTSGVAARARGASPAAAEIGAKKIERIGRSAGDISGRNPNLSREGGSAANARTPAAATAAAALAGGEAAATGGGRPRWPAESEHDHGRGQGRGGQGEFCGERSMGAVDTRGRWEGEGQEEETEDIPDSRVHHRDWGGPSEGGPLPGERRHGGGGFDRDRPYAIGVDRDDGPDAPRYEDGLGQQQGPRQSWARRADVFGGEHGYGRWDEEENEMDAEGERHLDSRKPCRSGGGHRGGSQWHANDGEPLPVSRPHDDAAAPQPPLDGFQHVLADRDERFLSNRQQQQQQQQQPGGQGDRDSAASHMPGLGHSRRDEHEDDVDVRHRGEVLATDDADADERNSSSSYRDGRTQASLGSSWGGRLPLAASSDGVRYDPMRYEKAAAASHGVTATKSLERGARAGNFPDPPEGERVGGGGAETAGGIRSGSGAGGGEGRHLMRAESLDRASSLRHSDSLYVSAVGGGNHARFADTLYEAKYGRGSAAAETKHAEATRGVSRVEPSHSWRRPDAASQGEEERGAHEPPPRSASAATASGANRLDEEGRLRMASHSAERESLLTTRSPPAQPRTTVPAAEALESGVNASAAGAGAMAPAVSGGGKVEHVLRDGRRVILFANGTQKEMLPDGGCVVRFLNGDLKRVEGGTGVVVYTYAAARTTHTMHPSGLEVFEFPNGQVERHHKSGEKEIDFPDGTRKYTHPSGREMSEFPDGVTVVEYPEGHRDVTSPGGTTHRERPDGTIEAEPAGAWGFRSGFRSPPAGEGGVVVEAAQGGR